MNLETLKIKALDGYTLSGRRYSGQVVKGRIVLAGATGVPQGFYRYFAEAAVSRDFEVITFDYRGIGESAPKSLRAFEMNYLDWAQLDLAGVLHALGSDKGVHLVGHSFGGQTLGVLPDLTSVISLHTFATGAGWHGWMPKGEQIRVKILWNIVGPIVTRTKGYLAWKKLGLGEDLPIGVYRQWKHWCKFPNYWFGDPKLNHQMRDSFARVRVPVTALNAIDDRWATPRSRDAFMNHYVNSDLKLIDLDPDEFNLRAIGHMGYFRRGSDELWNLVFEDLEKLNA